METQFIRAAKAGDTKAMDTLIHRYMGVVKATARGYYLVGGDREDVVQEGLIGLYQAIQDFDETKESSFRSFAVLCIKRRIITAVKSSRRQKHTPLNSYTSLSNPLDGQDQVFEAVLASRSDSDPAEQVIGKVIDGLIKQAIDNYLTTFERNAFRLHMVGLSYAQMAVILGCSQKSIDNALQRAKSKLQTHLREYQPASNG